MPNHAKKRTIIEKIEKSSFLLTFLFLKLDEDEASGASLFFSICSFSEKRQKKKCLNIYFIMQYSILYRDKT